MNTWWGYVTSTSPLLVGRESTTSPGSSVQVSGCLVAGLTVGDRVLVWMHGTAATVLGRQDSSATRWQAFTPQMYAGTTPHPSWGNTTRKGRWVQEASGTVHFTAEFVFGSTYVGVPGNWSLGLPTPSNNAAYNLVVLHVTSSTVVGGEKFGSGKIEATADNTTVKRLYAQNSNGTTFALAGDDPWASGNRLIVTGTYEKA